MLNSSSSYIIHSNVSEKIIIEGNIFSVIYAEDFKLFNVQLQLILKKSKNIKKENDMKKWQKKWLIEHNLVEKNPGFDIKTDNGSLVLDEKINFYAKKREPFGAVLVLFNNKKHSKREAIGLYQTSFSKLVIDTFFDTTTFDSCDLFRKLDEHKMLGLEKYTWDPASLCKKLEIAGIIIKCKKAYQNEKAFYMSA